MKQQPSFTMIEMMVVVILIGIIATIAIPGLALRKPEVAWPFVLHQVEALVGCARQEAIAVQRPCRIMCTAGQQGQPDSFLVEQQSEAKNDPIAATYAPLQWPLGISEYKLPEIIKIHRLYVDGQLVIDGAGKANWAISSTGLGQQVVLQLINKTDEKKPDQETLFIPAFSGKCLLYDGHTRPDREAQT